MRCLCFRPILKRLWQTTSRTTTRDRLNFHPGPGSSSPFMPSSTLVSNWTHSGIYRLHGKLRKSLTIAGWNIGYDAQCLLPSTYRLTHSFLSSNLVSSFSSHKVHSSPLCLCLYISYFSTSLQTFSLRNFLRPLTAISTICNATKLSRS